MSTFSDETINALANELTKAKGKEFRGAADALLELQRQNKEIANDLARSKRREATEETARFASYWRHVRQPENCIINVKPTQAEWGSVSTVAYTSAEQLDHIVELAIKRTAQANETDVI